MKLPTSISDLIKDAAENFAYEVQELVEDDVVLEHDEDLRTFLLTVRPSEALEEPLKGSERLPEGPPGRIAIRETPALFLAASARQDN